MLSVGQTSRHAAQPSAVLVTPAFTAGWAAFDTRIAATRARHGVIRQTTSSTNGDWQALDNAATSLVTRRVHAIVDGEIAADEIGSHRCILTSKPL